MHGHGHQITHVEDPGPVGFAAPLRIATYAAAAIGLVLAGISIASNPLRGWQGLLVAYSYFLMLGLGGIVFASIQYCANARWSVAVRRIAEGFGAFIPVSFVIFLVIATGGWSTLYDLNSPTREAVGKAGLYFNNSGNDIVTKGAWLSQAGVIGKGVAFYAVWFILAHLIRKNSLDGDKTRDQGLRERLKDKNVRLCIVFLTVFAYTFSLHVIDTLMALEAKWFSTMFGVYCFAGLLLSAMALTAIIAVAMRKNRIVAEAIQPRHLYDLGQWIMAFSCFMCYIGFSQFMLIWYANLPEETFYMIARTEHGWGSVMLLLPLLKWIIPFAVLMPQGFRNNPVILVPVCVGILVGQWIDLYWIVYPVFFKSPIVPGIPEIGTFLAVLGLFGIVLDRVYSKHSVLAMGDPHLVMSVNGSYV